MQNVAHKITLGGANLQAGKDSPLLALTTRAELGVPVNACRIVLDGQAQVSAKPGDDVRVELGYDSTLTKVFSGKLDTIERGLQRITVEALGSFAALSAARLNRLYEKQNAGEIVGDLLGKQKVRKGTLENGEKFATFVVSDHQTVWAVIAELAQRCGFDFYADPEDKAIFKAHAAQQTHAFSYGVDILEYAQDSCAPAIDGVEVYGESPVGQGQGDDASSWLTKKAVKGTAGKSSGNLRRLSDASARTQSLVKSVAENILKTYQAQASGRLRVLGAPDVRLGDAVRIADMPDTAQNGTFKVTGVRHRLNAQIGFVTDVTWEKR
jgi:hypothetical protein